MKILIVKLSSIGDVIHTLPTLAAIRRALPEAEISWAVERSAAEILRGNRLIDHLIEVDTRSMRGAKIVEGVLLNLRKQLKNLRVSDFDVALDFQGLWKSAAIAKLSKAARRYGFSKAGLREPASRFLLNDTFETASKINVIRKNLTLARKALNISIPESDYEFPIDTTDAHRAEAAQIIERAGANYAIINPAGGWQTKLWAAEKFGALADKLWEENGLVSIITTAPNEIELAETVRRSSRSGKTTLAQPTLKGFYELAKRAVVYIGGDTAPTHLAVAAKTPLVGIFGPTEWWRNGSPNEDDVCVERTDIFCRADCHRRSCDNWICLDVSVETVYRAVQKRLKLDAAAENREKNKEKR